MMEEKYGFYSYFSNGTDYDFPELGDSVERKVSRYMILCLAPILVILGTIGNLLSLMVLQSSLFRKTNCGFLLSMLALADIGVLNTGLLRMWIMELSDMYDIRNASKFSCKAHIYFTYFFPQLSSWTLVLVTIDRLISVAMPLHAKQICSYSRVIIAWCVMTFVLMIVNVYPAHMHELEHGAICMVSLKIKTDTFRIVTEWVDFNLTCLVPFIIITTCNVFIIHKMVRAKMNRQTSLNARHNSTCTAGVRRQSRNMQSTTIMLVLLSVTFLVTTIPRSVYFLGMSAWHHLGAHHMDLIYKIVILIYNISNAVNFLLYCVSGSRFRQAMCNVLCCTKGPHRRSYFFTASSNSFKGIAITSLKNRKPSFQTQLSTVTPDIPANGDVQL